MRQVTIIKTCLKYSELTEKQKIKVLEHLADINTHHDWYEYTFETWTEKLTELGYSNIKFYFSGFSSQGDGASFEADHDLGRITQSGRYYHENTMGLESAHGLKAAKHLEDSKALARQIYRDLNKEYDYLMSREAIEETIEANEYEFDSETLKIASY